MRASRPACAPALALGVAIAVLSGCGLGGVPQDELPDAPIAISYRTPEEARRRAEDYAADRERSVEAQRGVDPRGGYADLIADEESVTELFDRLFGRGAEEESQHPGRLALLDARTGRVEVVAAARRGSIPLAWSSDHERLLFTQPDAGDFQIYEYALGDRTVRPVTLGPPSHTQACYGPDGRIVVAAVDARAKPVRSYIAISGPGGRRPFQPLSAGPSDHSPACREDGGGVVFVREEDPPRADLYTVDLAPGSEPRRLSPGRHPAFSADGEWIAFSAPVKRELRIWRIRPDGTGRAPIGHGIRHEARPAVSPDGTLVAYVAAEEAPRRHLYLRRFDGSGDRILFADGDGEYPVW